MSKSVNAIFLFGILAIASAVLLYSRHILLGAYPALLLTVVLIEVYKARVEKCADTDSQRFPYHLRLAIINATIETIRCAFFGLAIVTLLDIAVPVAKTLLRMSINGDVLELENGVVIETEWIQRYLQPKLYVLVPILFVLLLLQRSFTTAPLLRRWDRFQTITQSVVTVLMTISCFTFFTVKDAPLEQASWVREAMRNEAAFDVDNLDRLRSEIAAEAMVELRLQYLPDEAKHNLVELFIRAAHERHSEDVIDIEANDIGRSSDQLVLTLCQTSTSRPTAADPSKNKMSQWKTDPAHSTLTFREIYAVHRQIKLDIKQEIKGHIETRQILTQEILGSALSQIASFKLSTLASAFVDKLTDIISTAIANTGYALPDSFDDAKVRIGTKQSVDFLVAVGKTPGNAWDITKLPSKGPRSVAELVHIDESFAEEHPDEIPISESRRFLEKVARDAKIYEEYKRAHVADREEVK